MKKKILVGILSVLLLGLISVSVGCNKQEEQKPENIKFGTPSETAKKLELTNNTGKDVKSVSVKLSGKTDSVKLSISDGDVWKANTVAEIYLESASDTSAKGQSGDVAVRANYDLTFNFDQSDSATLHNIVQATIEDYHDAKLCFSSSDKLVFIEYKDNSGNDMSTLAAEQKIVADAKAAQDAAAAQKAAEEAAAAAAQKAAEEQAEAKSYAGSSSSGESASSSQQSQGCQGGGIVLR